MDYITKDLPHRDGPDAWASNKAKEIEQHAMRNWAECKVVTVDGPQIAYEAASVVNDGVVSTGGGFVGRWLDNPTKEQYEAAKAAIGLPDLFKVYRNRGASVVIWL